MKELAQQLRSGSYKAPKTILGFFAVIVAIVVAGVSGAAAILSRVDNLHYLIPWVLLFGSGVVVAVLLGVFVTAWKDPTVLMLGEISGHEYIENRKLTLGDSEGIEYTEDVILPVELDGTAEKRLPVAKSAEEGAE